MNPGNPGFFIAFQSISYFEPCKLFGMTLIGRIIKASIDLRGKIEIVPFSPFISQKRVLKKLIRKAQFTMFG